MPSSYKIRPRKPYPRKPITHERLKEVLHYDPDTGRFTWIKMLSFRVSVGDEAGSVDTHGYIETQIDGTRYRLHRLAWFYMTGEWPEEQIDHIDLCRNNNKWANLRKADHGQNVQNSGPRKNNAIGLKGVSFSKPSKKWRAEIMAQGNRIILGFFDDPETAHAAYVKAALELHRDFARTS